MSAGTRVLIGAWLLVFLLSVSGRAEPLACPPQATALSPEQIAELLQKARDRGALWRFEKDGRRGYLYGSAHVGKPEWAAPGPRVREALLDAQVIALEADPRDQGFRTGVAAPAQPQEAPSLPAAVQQRLRAQATKACVPWENLQAMPPMLIVMVLTVLDVRWEGLWVDYATEMILVGVAQSSSRTIESLETAAIQRAAIMGGGPSDQLALIERSLTALENGSARRDLITMATAWADADLDRVARSVAQMAPHDRAALQHMVFSRNPALAARIEELHQSGSRLFVAVGLLHMIGDSGLPALLAARGFTVQRIPFDTP